MYSMATIVTNMYSKEKSNEMLMHATAWMNP